MEIINNEKYYRTGEWSKMINRKRETISEWCTDGKLKSIKKGKFYLISETEMNYFLRNNKGRRRLTKDRIEKMIYEKLSKEDYNIIEINEGLKGKIIMKHLICNNIYNTNISDLYYQNTKCPFCNRRKAYTIEEVKKICKDLDKEYEVVDTTYINNKTPIKIKHLKCNKIFEMRFGDFKNLNRRCPHCKSSKAENKIIELLEYNDIEYIQNYKINHNKKRQFVDFKISINNKEFFLEFDGMQHFYPFYTNKLKSDQKELENTKTRDLNKNDYFETNKKYLYRISYSNYENLEDIICNILNEKINPKFNDYPLGEYAKVCGNKKYSYIIFIG